MDEPVALLQAGLEAVRGSEPPLCGRPDRVAALGRAAGAAYALYLRELGQLDASGEYELEQSATAAAWVRRELLRSEREASRDVALSRRLRALPLLADAVLDGEVSIGTAEVVARAALALPEELVGATEPALVDAARLMPPDALRRFLAEKIASLAPEALDRAVQSAWDRRELRLSRVQDVYKLDGTLEPLVGERLDTVLDALMESDRRAEDTRTRPQRRADALALLLDIAGEGSAMPAVRGSVPHLLIISEEGRPAHSVGGTVLTDGQLDEVACTAEVTQVVVDRARRPLSVGRSSRNVGRRLWLAIVVRDEGRCQVAGCSAPPSRCVPHHIVPWSLDGPTDLDNLVLICVQHHHALHDRSVNLRLQDGRVLTPTGLAWVPTRPEPPPVLAA